MSDRACFECRNFIKDAVGDGWGIGKCKLGDRKKHPVLWARTPACKVFVDVNNKNKYESK
jgi:hypothetical protein